MYGLSSNPWNRQSTLSVTGYPAANQAGSTNLFLHQKNSTTVINAAPLRTQETANQLSKTWANFKAEFFTKAKQDYDVAEIQDGNITKYNSPIINKYFDLVYEQLADKQQDLDSNANGDFKQAFTSDRIPARNMVITNMDDLAYEKAFEQLGSEERTKLLQTLAYTMGTGLMRKLKPCLFIEKKANDYFAEQAKKYFTDHRIKGIKFINCGTSSATFVVKDADKPYYLQLDHCRDNRDESNPDHRLATSKEYERAGITKTSQLLKALGDKAPKTFKIQELAHEGTQYLGTNSALATESIPGVNPYYEENSEALKDFVTKGLSDEFLKEFIPTYIKLVNAGADLSGLMLHHTVYKDGALNFVSVTGLPGYDKLRELIKAKPLMFCIYKLLTVISTMQLARFEKTDKFTAIAEQNGISADQFFNKRFEQLQRCLEAVSNDPNSGISKEDIQTALQDLKTESENPQLEYCKILGGKNMLITDRGQQYLNELIKHFAA